jgi:dipeptidyl aminopeptidase/acylaminoacyl peptidase
MTRLKLGVGLLAMIATTAFVASLTQTSPRAAQVPAAARPSGRALTIEDYYRVQTVGGVQIAPNGRFVLFTVTTRVEENNGSRSEAYVVPSDASARQRKIQHEGKDVTGAGWTPDSLLRYTANGQTFQIDPGTPSAVPTPLAASASGVGAPAGRGDGRGGGGRGGGAGTLSPDGKWAVQLRDKPQPKPTPPPMTDFEKRHEDRFKGVTFDWMAFQRDGAPFPVPNPTILPAQQIVLQPADGAAGDSKVLDSKVLFDQDLRPANIVWHPNGQLIAFTADPVWREEMKYDRPDIFTVTTDGKVTRVTDDGYVHSDLDFSPDGKFMSYATTFGTDMIIQQKLNHGGPRDLYVRPAGGGAPINLTASWDLEPGNSQWSPDGRFLYFTAEIGGETHLFRVAAPASPAPPTGSRGPSSKVEQVTKGERRITGLSYDKAFTKMAYTVGLHESPPEVWVANIDGTNEHKLSDVHAPILTEIAFGRTDRLKWPSKDGTPIEGWLTYPYGYDRARGPYPLIVFSHGGPHAATGYAFDFKKQLFAANGYFVLDTNFRSSTGYGDAFKWATWGAWGDKDGEDIIAGMDYVIARYPIDAKRVGHTGHSYGGFMTNWIITQYPDRFAAAVTGAGITNWTSDYGNADIFRTKETEFFGTPWDTEARNRMIRQSPLTYAGRVKTPTLFIHGEVDHRVPFEEGEQMYFALKRRGVPAKMIQYAGQPHGIAGNWNVVHRMINELRWWKQYLH